MDDRLSPSWLASAQHIRTATRLILYHGQAMGSYSADGKNWTGEIEGEVLVLQEHFAQASPRVQLLPDGAIESISLTRNVFDHSGLSAEQVAAWHKLFAEKSPPEA